MLFKEKPDDFKPAMKVVGCFCEKDGKIILLLRNENKPQGNTWGVPAGKVEADEALLRSMAREIKEELGLSLETAELIYQTKYYVRYPEFDFVYHVFKTNLREKVEIKIDKNDHQEFRWVLPAEALTMNLIPDEDSCIKYNLDPSF
jgi:8-oxo-dGTP pyrophosphatase MutT (NUDIX family)